MEAGISACAKHFIFIGENSTVEIFEVFTEVAVSVSITSGVPLEFY